MDDDAVGFPAALALLLIGAPLGWYGHGHDRQVMASMGAFLLAAGIVCALVAARRRHS